MKVYSKAVIVGASRDGDLALKGIDTALIIAADGGYTALKEIGVTPSIVLGDFDSGEKPEFDNVIKLPVEKDDTDTVYAVKLALENGIRDIELYRCLGGDRLDHTVATLQTLSYIVSHGGSGVAYGDASEDGKRLVVRALKDGNLTLSGDYTGILSVFAVSDCKGVTIRNVKYPLEDAELAPDFPLGVSNAFINGKRAEISVTHGTLIIMYREA